LVAGYHPAKAWIRPHAAIILTFRISKSYSLPIGRFLPRKCEARLQKQHTQRKLPKYCSPKNKC